MKKEELYEAVLRAMQNQVPNDHRFCSNCIAHLVKAELNNISFYDYKGYHKDSCSSPLFYLEDLGIIKILQGVANRSSGVDCNNLKIKVLHPLKVIKYENSKTL